MNERRELEERLERLNARLDLTDEERYDREARLIEKLEGLSRTNQPPRALYIPRGGHPPACIEGLEKWPVTVTRRADCGFVQEVYDWDPDTEAQRIVSRKRVGPEAYIRAEIRVRRGSAVAFAKAMGNHRIGSGTVGGSV